MKKVEKISQGLTVNEELVEKVHSMALAYVRRRYVKDRVNSDIVEAKKQSGIEEDLTDSELFRLQYEYARLLLERASKY